MANPNSTGMDELKTKWMIEKITSLHKVIIEGFDARANKLERKGDKGISELKDWRAIGTSALAGVISIIIVLNSTYTLEIWSILIILISLICILVAYFIILTKIIGIVQNIVDDIQFILQEGVEILSYSHSYFLSHVADINKINSLFVKNYFNFVKLLVGAFLAYASTQFRSLAKHYEKFHDLKNNLEEDAKQAEKYLESIPQYYKEFDPSKEIPQELLEFVEKELKKYKPKETTNGLR